MFNISKHVLGTWSFSNDKWWGYQDDRDSLEVMDCAIDLGIRTIDTAPAYGRGKSEELIGSFVEKRGLRDKIQIMSKFGLRFEGRKVEHDLSKKQLDYEIDISRQRLKTDYLDVYFAHWPDPNTKIESLAENLYSYYRSGIIRAVGLSNFVEEDIKIFIKHCPLHIIQSPYSMWQRDNENALFKFAKDNDILVSAYSPLERGVLTGKFFADGVKIPKDLNRKYHEQLRVENFEQNKLCIRSLGELADSLSISLTQLVIAWTKQQDCLDLIVLGSRNKDQLEENSSAFSINLSDDVLNKIEEILKARNER